MTSKHPSLRPIAKEQFVSFSPSPGKAQAGNTNTTYNRRREQVRRAQRNHRDRQKQYVRSMENEVLRLQKEWAAVLQEIERATKENLILKDILRRQPPPISSRASTPSPLSSRTTSFSESVNEMKVAEDASMDSPDHSRQTFNTVQLSPLNSMTISWQSVDLTGPVHIYPPGVKGSEALGVFMTPSASSENLPCSETPETYRFFLSPSISHHSQDGNFQLQHGPVKGMDEGVSSVSPKMSCRHPKMPEREHHLNSEKDYIGLDPCLTSNDCVHSFEKPYENRGQEDHSNTESPACFNTAGIPASRDSWNRALPSACSHNFHCHIDQSFLLEADPTAMQSPSPKQLYSVHGDLDESFLLEAGPISAQLRPSSTSLLYHLEQLQATDWWQEMV